MVDIEIVGEASYQDHIRAVLDRHGRGPFTIGLRAEPSNPFDSNAVAVYADGGVVGYLPRNMAAAWQEAVAASEARGQRVLGQAEIFGGTPEAPNLGVFGTATWPGTGKPVHRWN